MRQNLSKSLTGDVRDRAQDHRMNDFDFLIGSWNVVNRVLTNALFTGGDDWDSYPATATCQRILGGAGTLDEMIFPTKGGLRGLTLRLFDPERKEWSIYWATDRLGVLGPPVVGTFADGRGDFHGDDTHEGKPIKVHFVWSDITGTSARWLQRFSNDGGRNWETNWIMELTRA
jgi:hypothetical protein